MDATFPLKRLFRIALSSSTVIGLITVGPVYLVTLSFWNIHIDSILVLKLIAFVVLGVSFLVFLFWTINIWLTYLIHKHSWNLRLIFLGYLLGFMLIISIKLIFNHFIINPSLNQESVEYGLKEFGVTADNWTLMQSQLRLSPYLIIIFVVFSINTVVIIFLRVVLFAEEKTAVELENNQLRIKNIEATNQRLRQQLQPHFLFNSLNVLKTLIGKQPDNAEAYLKRLSDLLRASISLDNTNTVKLEDEFKLCMDYLEMQKIRFGEALRFEINIPEGIKARRVPAFSIQLLLENAMKHNAFTKESPICIKLIYHDNWITVSNNIQPKNMKEESPGLGLLNLSERYKIISGDEIIIQSNETQFAVSIKILDNENSDYRR